MGKLTKAQMDEIAAYYADHIRGCERRLPLKARVVMDEELLRQMPRYRGVRGTIVGHVHHGTGASPKVLWDGRRTADSYAPWFIRRIKPADDLPRKPTALKEAAEEEGRG